MIQQTYQTKLHFLDLAFQKKIKIKRVQREMTLPSRRSKYLETSNSIQLLSKQNWRTLNYYVESNVKIIFTLQTRISNSSSRGKLYQYCFKIEYRGARNNNKRKKDVTSKFIADKSWPLFPTSRTLTLSTRIEYFRYDPSPFKNTSALFPAPSQISKSREGGIPQRAQPRLLLT